VAATFKVTFQFPFLSIWNPDIFAVGNPFLKSLCEKEKEASRFFALSPYYSRNEGRTLPTTVVSRALSQGFIFGFLVPISLRPCTLSFSTKAKNQALNALSSRRNREHFPLFCFFHCKNLLQFLSNLRFSLETTSLCV